MGGASMTTVVSVRFRSGCKTYYFDPKDLTVEAGQDIIVETAQGPEFAQCSEGNHQVPDDAVVKPLRSVLRIATDNDKHTAAYNRSREKEAFDVCKKKGIPHVWHQREYQDLDFGLHFFPSWAVYKRKLHDEINYNISITKNLFEYRHLRVGRDEVVYDGVFSLEQIEGLSNTKPKENYVFFAGRIQEAKGTYDLIKTYKEFHDKFPQIKLLIAGPYATSSNYYIKCKKYVLSNKLEDSVIFLGQRNDVYELMAKAKMLIVPSRFEGFGFITTEAMLNHCVVVGRNTAGTKEQFDNGLKEIGREIGFRFKTSKEMLNSMIKVMEEDTCQMEEDAYNVVKKLYSAEQNVDKIESLYKKILSNK